MENGNQLYVPVGFAHGLVTLEPDSEIVYKCTDYYSPETEGVVRWDSCGIEWPISDKPTLSYKDRVAPSLADFNSPLFMVRIHENIGNWWCRFYWFCRGTFGDSKWAFCG